MIRTDVGKGDTYGYQSSSDESHELFVDSGSYPATARTSDSLSPKVTMPSVCAMLGRFVCHHLIDASFSWSPTASRISANNASVNSFLSCGSPTLRMIPRISSKTRIMSERGSDGTVDIKARRRRCSRS